MADDPVVETRVARADWNENAFRGRRVNAELVGRAGWADIFALAMNGRPLSANDAAVFEDVAVCALAADPRIWPVKVARLVASFGSPLLALAAGHAALEGAIMGPVPTGAAAEMLVSLRDRLGDRAGDPIAIEALVDDLLSRGRVAGFGVAFRGVDERVVAMKDVLRRRGRDQGTFWHLIMSLDDVMERKKRLHVNFSMATGAILLDLGFAPNEISLVMSTYLDVCFYANVLEGSEQKSAVLRKLSDASVEYVGRPARESPRYR
jgi:hypothetical protein